jgi:MFS family permease
MSARVSYGWVVVGALALFSAVSVGMGGANTALFIRPAGEDVGWSAGLFGWAQFARLAAMLAGGPLIGWIIDRRGARLPVLAALGVAAAALLALSRADASWMLVALFVLMGLVGMGRASDLFVTAPVAGWFPGRGRGLALGIALAGTPAGVVLFFPLTQWLIEALGWRTALVALGAGGFALAAPAALLLRRAPAPVREGTHAVASLSRAQAMRGRDFWLLTAGFAAMLYGFSAVVLFRVPALVERGAAPGLVAWAIALDAVVAVLVSLLAGKLVDRLGVRALLGAGLAAGLASAGGLLAAGPLAWVFIVNIGYAVGFQTSAVAGAELWARRYGPTHLGAIRGASLPISVAVGAAAFPVTGMLRDATGAYAPAWWVAGAAFILAGALLARVSGGRRGPGGPAPGAPPPQVAAPTPPAPGR